MSTPDRPLRLLFVSPHFQPINAPDGQRLRMLLPQFVASGCECTVLAARPEDCLAPIEPELLKSLPKKNLTIHRIMARPARWGIRNIGLRVKSNLAHFAEQLLSSQKFDLVYFTTTQFACLPLAQHWLKLFDLPYVIDLQDPWVNDYYERPGAPPPPGGWKYRLARWSAKRQEPQVLRECSHLVSVSPDYITSLSKRYSWFNADQCSVIPFGWSPDDQSLARALPNKQPLQPVIRYIGRVGDDMANLLDALFSAVATWQSSLPPTSLFPTWEFIGTSYAGAAGGGVVQSMAKLHGLSEQVSEQPLRIGYFDGLSRMQSSWANLVLGSDDRGYSPSKTWPLLATGRPWLAMTHPHSIIHNLLPRDCKWGCIIQDHRDTHQTLSDFLNGLCEGRPPDQPTPSCLSALSTTALAQTHLEIFTKIVANRSSH